MHSARAASRLRSSFVTSISVALIMTTLAITPATSNSGEPPSGVSLEGYWRFIIDDDPAYSDPAFDDSAWDEVLAPETGGQYALDDVDAIAWFRTTFTLPVASAEEPLWASLGVIDDADEVFINGTMIGASGAFPPNARTAFFHQRLYAIPDGLLTFGDDAPNTIAVRVRDSGGGGGIGSGPVGIFTRDEVRRELWGVAMTPIGGGSAKDVRRALERQAELLAAGDIAGYSATLDPRFFHSGHDVDRQAARMARVTAAHPGITRVDDILEIGHTPEGLLVAEVRRTWSDAGTPVAEEPGIARAPSDGPDAAVEFLYFDPATLLEVGNHARFYRDFVNSEVSGTRREFDVYLPPSYFDDPTRRYPSVYHLHGAGGSNRQWEGADMDRRLDRLIGEGFIEEMVVIMPPGRTPDGVNTWYVNTSVEQWRSMFFEDLIPLVDATYRTIDDRTKRGIGGWSMGGQGAFTAGWAGQHLFGSIASLTGVLNLPPLAGSAADMAANSAETPTVQVAARDPLFLRSYCYWLYAGADDALSTGTQMMEAGLISKTVLVQAELKPGGLHNNHTELPGITPAFRLHSLAFSAHDDLLGCQATVPINRDPVAVDDAASVEAGNSAQITVLANDSDVDHDDLRVASVTDPSSGTARVEFGGIVSYVPDAGFVGTDTFEYTIDDGRAGASTAMVTVTVTDDPAPPSEGRVHGSGKLERGSSDQHDKISFSFDAKVEKGELEGKLKVKDKDLEFEIYAKEVTSLSDGTGVVCDGIDLTGVPNAFAFTAAGDWKDKALDIEGTGEYFACGIDNGKTKNGQPADVLYVEVTSGTPFPYSTGDRTGGDNSIDGGNIHLHDPIVATGSTSSSAGHAGGEAVGADNAEVAVVELDPMFVDELAAGELLLLTVTAHGTDGAPTSSETVTLSWVTDGGVFSEMTVLTDVFGVGSFTLAVPLGDTEVTASVGGVGSNPIWVAGG